MKIFEGKIPVGILGATGMVGQKFVELLAGHPWFEIVALAASERSVGKKYGDTAGWKMSAPLPERFKNMEVQACHPGIPCRVVFSGLDSQVAGPIEGAFAKAGYVVISNSKNHRMDPLVPLVVPEVNPDHLELVKSQQFGQGMIVTNPNCSVVGLTMALKPLIDLWGVEKVHAMTMQAISGAGYPGISGFDIIDNVIPFISGEEEKLESEPLKIFGNFKNRHVTPSTMQISAHCNRVAVMDGHVACVSVRLKSPATAGEIIHAWRSFSGEAQTLGLPSAPGQPIVYLDGQGDPQPKIHRLAGNGMAVSIGRLRECPLLGWKFVLLSHNTIRGAAGCAVLNGEMMYKKGLF